jgi:hypothetical protein
MMMMMMIDDGYKINFKLRSLYWSTSTPRRHCPRAATVSLYRCWRVVLVL